MSNCYCTEGSFLNCHSSCSSVLSFVLFMPYSLIFVSRQFYFFKFLIGVFCASIGP